MSFYRLDSHFAFLVSQKALIVESGRLLVLENTAHEHSGQYGWELPGGLLNPDESLQDGLIREVREETGLDITVGSLVVVWYHWEHGFLVDDGRSLDVRIVGLAYLCESQGGDVHLSDEHRQYCWTSPDELASLPFAQNSAVAIQQYLARMHP